MAPVTSLSDAVNQQLTSALSATLPEADADPLLRRSDRADFQANGVLALAKKAKANKRAKVLFKARMARIQAGLKSDTDMAALGKDGE